MSVETAESIRIVTNLTPRLDTLQTPKVTMHVHPLAIISNVRNMILFYIFLSIFGMYQKRKMIMDSMGLIFGLLTSWKLHKIIILNLSAEMNTGREGNFTGNQKVVRNSSLVSGYTETKGIKERNAWLRLSAQEESSGFLAKVCCYHCGATKKFFTRQYN